MLIRFPVQLPPNFLKELGFAESDARLVAFHYIVNGEMLVRENGETVKPCRKEKKFLYDTFTVYPPVQEWLTLNSLDLLTYWLIYDYQTYKCYIADNFTAAEILESQQLPKVIPDGKSRRNSERPARRRKQL